MRKLIGQIILALFILPVVALADEQHTLDGNSYVVQVQKSGAELFQNENLEFDSGNFSSTFMEDKDYGKAPYSARAVAGELKWTATLKNKSGELLIWDGKESEGKVEGAIVSKPSGATWSFRSAPRE